MAGHVYIPKRYIGVASEPRPNSPTHNYILRVRVKITDRINGEGLGPRRLTLEHVIVRLRACGSARAPGWRAHDILISLG